MKLKLFCFWLLAFSLVALLTVYLINLQVQSYTDGKLQTSITKIPLEELPRVAIVFGAGVRSYGGNIGTLLLLNLFRDQMQKQSAPVVTNGGSK